MEISDGKEANRGTQKLLWKKNHSKITSYLIEQLSEDFLKFGNPKNEHVIVYTRLQSTKKLTKLLGKKWKFLPSLLKQ